MGITLTVGGGIGLSQVNYPTGSYLDSNGNLYVADYFNCRILKYTNISFTSLLIPIVGQVVAGGSCGVGLNQMRDPMGIVVDELGYIYVPECGNNRVTRWLSGSASGTLIAGLANGVNGNNSSALHCPSSVYIDRNSTAYIADTYNNRVQKWLFGATEGTTVASIGFPADVFVDSYDILYVSSDGSIHRYYPNSTSSDIVASVTGGLSFGFRFDMNNDLYVTEYFKGVLKKFALVNSTCGS